MSADSDSETCVHCDKRDYRCAMVLDAEGWCCSWCDDYRHGLLEDVG